LFKETSQYLARRVEFKLAEMDLFFADIHYETDYEELIRRWVHKLRVYFASNIVHKEVLETVEVPETWWDAVKERFFFSRLKERFPVKYRVIKTNVNHVHVCPHIAHKWDLKFPNPHISFLMSEEVE